MWQSYANKDGQLSWSALTNSSLLSSPPLSLGTFKEYEKKGTKSKERQRLSCIHVHVHDNLSKRKSEKRNLKVQPRNCESHRASESGEGGEGRTGSCSALVSDAGDKTRLDRCQNEVENHPHFRSNMLIRVTSPSGRK